MFMEDFYLKSKNKVDEEKERVSKYWRPKRHLVMDPRGIKPWIQGAPSHGLKGYLAMDPRTIKPWTQGASSHGPDSSLSYSDMCKKF